jgi:tRNA dimethylallyltransferase
LRELGAARAGVTSLEEARIASQTATRQYAKRQLTWLRQRMKDWRWADADDTRNIISEIVMHYA